ncbi:MAG: hypothetical protein VX353_06880 [Actinomycetota bacterium]
MTKNAHETNYNYPVFSTVGTSILVATGLLAIFISNLEVLYIVVSLTLFVTGLMLALRAFGVSLTRSRYEIVTTSHLIILPKNTGRKVKIRLYGSLGTQVIVSILFAATQSSTNFAFGILASVFALGNLNMWAILNGTFKKK